MRRGMVALLLACPLGLAWGGSPQMPVEGLSDWRVTGWGRDAGGEFCSDFRLSAAQAGNFLRRAHVVSEQALHDGFDTLPCWVRGTARDGRGAWHWEVRAGGTALLESPDGELTALACEPCAERFGVEPPRRDGP